MARLGDKYQVGAKIGGGGMAEVYRGAIVGAEGFSRPVAIKRIHASLSRDPKFGGMFINEARIASLLHHANVCSILDFDRDGDGRYYLVMELVDGVDAHALVASGPVGPPVAAHIVAEVLKGLDYAHELMHDGRHLQIVHRDVSPHNVMLSWQGAVKLVDFGIAKAIAATNASQSGLLKGKVSYMSPEQAQGRRLDGRSDVFAVGVILHELLTASRLFTGNSEPEVLSRVISQPIPHPRELSPAAPADLAAVSMRMLERDPASRYASAHEALDAVLRCESVTPRGTLELRDLLAARFVGRAPIRRADSEPAFAPTMMADGSQLFGSAGPPPPAPRGATGTAPVSPAAVRATVGVATTLTAPGSTPVAAMITGPGGLGHASTVTAPGTGGSTTASVRRPSRTGILLVIATLVLCGGAVGTALWLKARGGGAGDASADPSDVSVAIPRDATSSSSPASSFADASAAASVADADTLAAPAPDAGSARPSDHSAPPRKPDRTTKKPDPARDSDGKAPNSDESPGTLKIRVQPWALVSVDGKSRGMTPNTLRLPPGTHTVEINNTESGKTERIRVDIESGKTREIARDWR